jgi:hypothetical protein
VRNMGNRVKRYDAFISYGHKADHGLGRAVQWGLQRFSRPWYRVTAMRVFRDETNLAVNQELWQEIEKALDRSEYFILLASTAAARSAWVEREAAHWLANRSSKTLLIGLVDGTMYWDSASRAFDREKTNALPPVLMKADLPEPMYADFTWIKRSEEMSLRNKRFAIEIARIASTISGRPLDELIGEDIRQRRRMRAAAIVGTSAIATATFFGAWQWQLASERQQLAFSSRLASHSHELLQAQPDLALLLAVKATKVANTVSARASLVAALDAEPAVVRFLRGHTAGVSSVVMSRDGRTAASGDETGQILFWDLDRRQELWPRIKQNGSVTGLAISPDGRILASSGAGNEILLWDIPSREQIGPSLVGHAAVVTDIAFANDRLLVSGSSDGTVALWDAPDRRLLSSLDAGAGNILRVVASQKGDLLAVAGTHGVRVLDLNTQRWQTPGVIGIGQTVLASLSIVSGSSPGSTRFCHRWRCAGLQLQCWKSRKDFAG